MPEGLADWCLRIEADLRGSAMQRIAKLMNALLNIDIRPVVIDGRHWVSISKDDREMDDAEPFPTADAAGTMADRLLKHWRARAANLPEWIMASPGVVDTDALVAYGRSLKHKG